MRHFLTDLLVPALALVLTAQQAAAQSPPGRPRADQRAVAASTATEVRVVQVDAAVVDAGGQFVTDLHRDEIDVYEDGVLQVLAGFELVRLAAPEAERPVLAARPMDTRTNARTFDGRLYLILMDDLHIAPSRSLAARRIARRFVERNLVDGDLGIVLTSSGRQAGAQGFTADRERLLRAIDGCVGSKIVSPSLAALSMMGTPEAASSGAAAPQRVANGRAALETLARVAAFADSVRQRRKALVLIGEGIDYDLSLRDAEASHLRDRFFEFVGAANRANLTVYAFDPRTLTHGGDDFVDIASTPPKSVENDEEVIKTVQVQNDTEFAQDNLRTLAAGTGGFANVASQELETSFDRIRDEHSRYYMIGYYPSNEAQDGTFRSIEVRSRRPGLVIRARRGYTAPKAGAERRMSAGNVSGDSAGLPAVTPAVERALASALPVSGLTLRAAAAAFRGPGGTASVSVIVQASGRDMLFVPKGDRLEGRVELAAVAIDASGRSAGGTQVSTTMPLSPRLQEMVARTGVVFQLRLGLKPGLYQLRVAGRDAGSGLTGSVHYDIDVPDFERHDISLSGVVLSAERAGQVASPQPDRVLAQWLPATPVTQREFSRDDTLTAVAELYVRQPGRGGDVRLVATVRDSEGRVYFSEDAARGRRGDTHAAPVHIPLAGFVPGIYVLRYDARRAGDTEASAFRDVVFAVR